MGLRTSTDSIEVDVGQSLLPASSPTFNGLELTSLQIVKGSLVPPTQGSRGPLFIWNSPTSTAAGQAACLELWMGSNPVANPSANDFVVLEAHLDTLNGRGACWGINLDIQQQLVASGGGTGIVRGIETDLVA